MSQPGSDHQPQVPHVYGAQPFGQLYGPQAYDGHGNPIYFPDLEGAAYKSKATTFAIIGIFVLGFVFGPLAILNAGRAEAMNVPATFGKVAGWIVTVLSFGSLILIIGAAVIGIIGANS